MNGVVNPIIQTLSQLDIKILKLIEITGQHHDGWRVDLSQPVIFLKSKPYPYFSHHEYIPKMHEIEGGFRSDLISLLTKNTDGMFEETSGYLIKESGPHRYRWFNGFETLNVIGWKP